MDQNSIDWSAEARTFGLCGNICEAQGPFYGFVCTLPTGHGIAIPATEHIVHQAIQVDSPASGAPTGRVNAAWYEDGSPAMEPVNMNPQMNLAPEQLAHVDQRMMAVSEKVNEMATQYRELATDNSAQDVLGCTKALFTGFIDQAVHDREALQLACETLAIALRKLAGMEQVPAEVDSP